MKQTRVSSWLQGWSCLLQRVEWAGLWDKHEAYKADVSQRWFLIIGCYFELCVSSKL